MTAQRWLLALVVATGLLAMHGITASTASAAAPCGAAVPHEHHGLPSDDTPAGITAAHQASDASPTSGHAGVLCLAILVGALVVGLLARRSMRSSHASEGAALLPRVTSVDRAPPDTLLSLLCVSRT